MEIPATWNSLEVAKLVSSALTPLAVAGVGVYIHRLTKRFEQHQWRNQKLIEKRLEIYNQLASDLNDNLCYFTYVGSWKDRKPPQVLASKRHIDKSIHLAGPLFSPGFFDACTRFQNLCFETYTGWGEDAKLRTNIQRRESAAGADWKPEWASMFSDSVSEPKEILKAYSDIMIFFSEEIGINDRSCVPVLGRLPANIC